MAGGPIADNPWAAAASWVGAPFSGGLLPLGLLLATWYDRGSLTRRHALAATALWAVLMAVYIPVFLLGMLLPAFRGEPPRTWAIAVAVAFLAISWGGRRGRCGTRAPVGSSRAAEGRDRRIPGHPLTPRRGRTSPRAGCGAARVGGSVAPSS